MRQVTTDSSLRIGELAERTGLTFGTLHHDGQIGLVRSSERTAAGHRRDSEADVRRLYHIVALRSLGVRSRGSPSRSDDGFTLKDAVTAPAGGGRRRAPARTAPANGAWSRSSR